MFICNNYEKEEKCFDFFVFDFIHLFTYVLIFACFMFLCSTKTIMCVENQAGLLASGHNRISVKVDEVPVTTVKGRQREQETASQTESGNFTLALFSLQKEKNGSV